MVDKELPMQVYTTKDFYGNTCKHLAINECAAFNAHLMHYVFGYPHRGIRVTDIEPLNKHTDRTVICWKPLCCLVGASDPKKGG